MNAPKSIFAIAVFAAIACITACFAQAPPTSPGVKPGLANARTTMPVNKGGYVPAPVVSAFRLGNGYTTVQPHADARGDVLDFQKGIAKALSKLDPRPVDRLARFQRFVGQDSVCIGWGGTIVSVTPSRPGWLVKVRVVAHLATSKGLAIPSDCVDETYRYSNGMFQYLGGEAPPDVVPGGMETF